MSVSRDHRWLTWPVWACSSALLAWMVRALVMGEIPFTGDLLHFHYPLRDFYARALSRGQAFDWMPSLFNGFYVVGEGQLGAYHPLHWVLYRWLPLDAAFMLELTVAYPALLIGMWRWLRPRVGDGPAACGAFASTFSGFLLVHGVHPNVVGVLAHVPWLLLAVDGLRVPPGASRGALRSMGVVALLTGSQHLLGHPQSVFVSVVIVAAYALFVLWGAPAWRAAAARLLGGLALGALVGALQLLATFDALQHSTRPQYDATFATAFSLAPSQAVQLVQPYLQWGRVFRWNEVPGAGDEYGVYVGAVALILVVWWMGDAWARRRDVAGRELRRLGWWTLAFGGLGVWLALGAHGGLFLLQTKLPILSQFRAPVRYTLFTQWSVAVVASLALARLLTVRDTRPHHPRLPLADALMWTVVGAVALSAGLGLGRGSIGAATVWAAWWAPAVLATAAMLITGAARGSKAALAGLALLTAVDLAVYGLGIPAWQDFLTRREAVAYLDSNSFLPSPGQGRLARGGFPNLFVLGGHRLADGYLGITPARRLDYRTPQALQLAHVDYVHRDFLAGEAAPDSTPLDHGWLRLPAGVPRAHLVADVLVSTAPATDVRRLDVARQALVDHLVELESGAIGRATIVRDDPGHIEVDVETGGRHLLFVSESFDDGWRALVDGEAAPVERVNGDFLGCVVRGGRHRVEFVFRPTHLVVGRWVSAAASLVALGLVAVSSRRRRA